MVIAVVSNTVGGRSGAVASRLVWWSDGLRLFEADIVCFNETANMDAREYSGGGSQCDINITNRLF